MVENTLPKVNVGTSMNFTEGSACANCKKHVASVRWTGDEGALAMVHGFYALWCNCCALEAQLTRAKERASMILQLERDLEKAKLEDLPVVTADNKIVQGAADAGRSWFTSKKDSRQK